MNALDSASTRPYLIRALYEWCTDHALTPFIAVVVDATVQVPRDISVPVDRVIAIYARENGQGMAFPVPVAQSAEDDATDEPEAPASAVAAPAPGIAAPRGGIQLVPTAATAEDDGGVPTDPPTPPRQRPALKRVK